MTSKTSGLQFLSDWFKAREGRKCHETCQGPHLPRRLAEGRSFRKEQPDLCDLQDDPSAIRQLNNMRKGPMGDGSQARAPGPRDEGLIETSQCRHFCRCLQEKPNQCGWAPAPPGRLGPVDQVGTAQTGLIRAVPVAQ